MAALDLGEVWVTVFYLALAVAYFQLGFHARRHFDETRVGEMEFDEPSLFWYPFAWPFYNLYKPTALRIRLAGKLILAVGVLVVVARNWV
jgi:hypothetical protein